MYKFLIFWIACTSFLQNNDYDYFEIEHISINEVSGDTILNVNYLVEIRIDNTKRSITEIQILDVNAIESAASTIFYDLQNQSIKLEYVEGFFSAKNLNDLEISNQKSHHIYYNCDSNNLGSKVNNFINHQLFFLQILTNYNDSSEYSTFSRNGYPLNYDKVDIDTSEEVFKLNNISLDDYCYNYYDCLVNRSSKLTDSKIQKLEQRYNKLDPSSKARVTVDEFISAAEANKKRQANLISPLLERSLNVCLNETRDLNKLELNITKTKDQPGIDKMSIRRDVLLFPIDFLPKKLRIKDLIKIKKANN